MDHEAGSGSELGSRLLNDFADRQVPEGAGGWRPFDASLLGGTVHDAFDRQAASTPDEVALCGPGGELSYRQLQERVHRGAGGLAGLGAAHRPVALCLAHDIDLVVAVFAVLKAGGVVLILDPSGADDINRAILSDAEPALLVVDDVAGPPAEVIPAELPVHHLHDIETFAPLPVEEVGPTSPAMLAYSSGTTGGAKAAVIPHSALLQLFRGAIDTLQIGPGDRLPMLFPISLAVAAYPMFLPLMVGGSLRIHDVRSHGLVGFPQWLARERVSVLYVSPTVARFMGEVPEGVDLSAIRVVVLGGERVDAEVVDIVHRSFGAHVTVVNGYGATETGVLTFFVVNDADRFGPLGVPVGSPIADTELQIVDDAGAQLPQGASGEVLVRSRYLLSGYWRRPDLDAAVLTAQDGVAVYRTGDVGFLDDSGNLVLVGRSDTEVKVRGHRVNPGEVEQALLALPEVADAVVEARPSGRGTNQLVAWIVPAPAADLSTIRASANRSIKGPLVPARLVLVERLPQLPNGKLDRRALPDPATTTTGVNADRPTTPAEARLLTLWAEILDLPDLGVHDDLADLGAQSFDLAWALVVIEERHGIRVPMSAMLEVRTVAQLAEKLEEVERGAAPSQPLVEVQPGSPDRPRLYLVHDLHGTAYGARHLAPALGEDQPVWGFESPFLEGRGGVADSLEELAGQYVDALRAVQPVGPYHLAGYSFGGILAFAIASHLSAEGDEVAFLGIVDVGPGYRGRHYNSRKMLDKPWSRVPMPPERSLPLSERIRWYRDLVRNSPRDAAYHVSLRTGLDRWLDPLQFRFDTRDGGAVPAHRRLWYAWRQHWELARGYRWSGRHYEGPLVLVWAAESAATDGTMGWADVVDGEIRIVHLDIPHERMLLADESVIVGAHLRKELDRALVATAAPDTP